MLLARLAAQRMAPTFTRTATTPFRMTAMRGFAYATPAPSLPKTLSVRMDGLFAKCMVAAVIYFAPQDIVFLGGLLYHWRCNSNSVSPKTYSKDPEAALEAYKSKKGLDNVNVSKGGTWKVSLR